MEELLSIQELDVVFQSEESPFQAVSTVSFKVHKGETVALVGESGSGKSVTSLSVLQLLPGNAQFPNGQILFRKKDGSRLNLLQASPAQLQDIRGNEIAMIFQEPMTSLNPVFTCGLQVQEAIRQHRRCSRKEARLKTLELFRQVELPDPEGCLQRYPHQLSGGQKQRVMIAMAMSCNPSLLIADEPTTALDVTVQRSVLQLMKQLQQNNGMGLLFITHDLGVVQEIADRVLVLYKGAIVEEGSTKEVFQNPQHPYTRALLACRPVLHPKGQPLPVVEDFIRGARFTTAESTVPAAPVSSAPAPENAYRQPLLSIRNLTVSFPAGKKFLGKPSQWIQAVQDVSFDIFPGETLGLVGESGCGKTTLGRTLLRLQEASSGSVLLQGQELLQLSGTAFHPHRRELQLVFQDPYSSLNPRIRIGAAIAEPMLVHGLASNSRQAKEQVMELLSKVDLPADVIHRYPHEFSGGQRQRLVIARALALQPKFIIWDESVSALDVSIQAQVLNLLNELKQQFGFTSLFISHDLSVVRYISDRILVMHQGKLVESGPAEEIWNHPQTDYTRQLLDAIPGRRHQASTMHS